jgi:DNA-binding beta-propeller fold protein YncE
MHHSAWVSVCSLALLGATTAATAAEAPPASLYSLTKTISLGSPERWDYLTYEPTSHRVYVTHNTSIDVLDGRTGEPIGKVTLPGANGVAAIPAAGKGYAASRTNKSVIVFDLASFKQLKELPADEDTDGVIYDPKSKRIFVMEGDPHAALVIDTRTDSVVGKIDLGGQPEFAAVDDAGHLFINIADQKAVVRVDTTSLKVEERWPVPSCESPHGIAVDGKTGRIFTTCVNAKLVVLDSHNGHVVAELPIGHGSDAGAFDPVRKRALSSNGEGSLSVIRQLSADKYESLGNVPTQLLARTMALDPESGRVYLVCGDRIEVDPTATNPRKRYGVKPGSVRILFFDPAS